MMDDCSRSRSLRYEAVRPFLRCLMLFVLLYSIANYGNILSDSTNEKEWLKRKYNES